MADSGPRILALGGASLLLVDGRPRSTNTCWISPGWSGRESASSGPRAATTTSIAAFYAFFARRAEASHLGLFDRRVDDIGAFLGEQDVIYVGGGNTADMLAVWRTPRRRPGAQGCLGGRRDPGRPIGRRDVLVRGGAHGFVRARTWHRSATGCASSRAASARTTTASRCAGRATRRRSGPARCRTATRSTTASGCSSPAASSPRPSQCCPRRGRSASSDARSSCRGDADPAEDPALTGWSRTGAEPSSTSRNSCGCSPTSRPPTSWR